MERDTLKKELHSVLITFKSGASGHDFVKAYQDCLGRPLDLARLGYKNIDALMASFPDVVERYNGVFVYKAKTLAATKNLQNLIAHQKDSSKNKNKFGLLRPVEGRPVLLNAPARTPTMSPAAKVCRPVDRVPIMKPFNEAPASFPNRYPTSSGNISAREKTGAPMIKQSASTSYLVGSRAATPANLVPTYRKPEAKANMASAPRPSLLWTTSAFPGDVAPAYWNCPGRYRWQAPVTTAVTAEVRPERNYAAGAAVDENESQKRINCQPKQNNITVPFANSSSANRSADVPFSKAQQATKAERDDSIAAEEKHVRHMAKEKTELCENSTSSLSSVSPEPEEENSFVTCTADEICITHRVISQQNMNNLVNENFSSGDEDGNKVSFRSLSALSNHEDVVNSCGVVEEPGFENGVIIEVVKFLDADEITFVRADSESISHFKTLFNEMRFAYGGDESKPLESLNVGEYVAVKCERHWLRGIVCAILELESALVFYSDVGELHKVAFTKIYPLLPRFAEVQQMAFVGKMLGVPRNLWNGSIESLGDWFKKMTLKRQVVAVAPEHDWSSRVGTDPVNLQLYMKERGINVNLNSMVKDKCMEMVGSTTITFAVLNRVGKALEDGK
ncbi:TUDOR domain containing protein [Trichuris trichiura]|uniref:TUDOR domain containing protein n=1 Tax=Trichuris trichiura TaxID=36087 RepID=A0A077ZDW9_TRITR|nr:TUDOR domain containing protein [Trichuris trichiura]